MKILENANKVHSSVSFNDHISRGHVQQTNVIKVVKKGEEHEGEILCVKVHEKSQFVPNLEDSESDLRRKEKRRRHVTNEISILKRLVGCEFMTQVKYVFQDPINIYIVMEMCDSNMAAFMNENKIRIGIKIDPSDGYKERTNFVRYYAREILLGLQTLHDKNIVYRDMKPGNFLMLNYHIKFSDFDLSKLVDMEKVASDSGTLEYIPPELAKCLREKTKENEENCGPTDNVEETIRRIMEMDINTVKYLDEPTEFADLIKQLLVRDPKKRLGYRGAKEVMDHVFFKNTDWEMAEKKSYQLPFKDTPPESKVRKESKLQRRTKLKKKEEEEETEGEIDEDEDDDVEEVVRNDDPDCYDFFSQK